MKQKIFFPVAVFLILVFLAACAVPAPTETILRITSTPSARATPTGTPISVTETAVPKPTSTPIPIATETPTLMPPGVCPPHENAWHAPADVPCMHHHHGVDPRSEEVETIFNLSGYDIERDLLDPYGELWNDLWLTSPIEEKDGFIYALFMPEGCPQNGQPEGSSEYGCITAVLVEFHDPGTLDHLPKRSHTQRLVAKICANQDGQPDLTACGILQIAAEHADYGHFDPRYKTDLCHLDVEPGYPYPQSLIDQPSYRTSAVSLSNTEFIEALGGLPVNNSYWVSTPQNEIVKEFYDPLTNRFRHMAWSSLDVFQLFPSIPGGARGIPDLETYCDLPGGLAETQSKLAEVPPLPSYEHRTFQLVHLQFDQLPTQPGTYWYDLNGAPRPTGACEGISATCVPYLVAGNLPPRAMLKYDAFFGGNCAFILCFIAETNGVKLIMPGLDVP